MASGVHGAHGHSALSHVVMVRSIEHVPVCLIQTDHMDMTALQVGEMRPSLVPKEAAQSMGSGLHGPHGQYARSPVVGVSSGDSVNATSNPMYLRVTSVLVRRLKRILAIISHVQWMVCLLSGVSGQHALSLVVEEHKQGTEPVSSTLLMLPIVTTVLENQKRRCHVARIHAY